MSKVLYKLLYTNKRDTSYLPNKHKICESGMKTETREIKHFCMNAESSHL